MALDFVVGNPDDKLSAADLPGCLEDEIHAKIFADTETTTKLCPQLLKIQEYYCDARYTGSELEALAQGLEKAIPRFADQPEVANALARLQKAAAHAAENRLALFFYGD